MFARIGGLAALASLLATPVAAASGFEAQVLAALNAARTRPADYAERLKGYRRLFHANLVVQPGLAYDVETVEGVAPVDEAISYLSRHRTLSVIQAGETLAEAAADHASDQARSGAVGHGGADGASPSDRARRRGGGPYVAEAIMYGASDADDVVRQLIVDDGVADRGHRTILFSPHLRYAGVACRAHPTFRTVCVIDLADTPDGREPDEPFEMAAR